MITFQAIIDEARKQKEVIVQGFYESIKKDYRDYSYYNVIAALDGGEEESFSFYVSNEVENAYHTEPNVKLFTISLDEDMIEEKENPSKERLSELFDEQLAWLEGYEEIRYFVKVKNVRNGNDVLRYDESGNYWDFGSVNEYASFRTKHTRKELEKAEFGEVFDNPLFEVEEIKAKS